MVEQIRQIQKHPCAAQALLQPETGMLALAEVFATPCDDTKWPHDHADKMTTLMYQACI